MDLIIILGLILFFGYIAYISINEYIMCSWSLCILLISGLIAVPYEKYTVLKPTEYKVETTQYKTFVYVNGHVFESDKKSDAEEWTKGLPGFLVQEYNMLNIPFIPKFTTNPNYKSNYER